MHQTLNQKQQTDLGLVVDHDGNLIFCVPGPNGMEAGTGLLRDAQGNLTFDLVNPITVGFLTKDLAGNFQFRTI